MARRSIVWVKELPLGAEFADVTIETSGGQDPVICHGHLKGDAVEMKRVIEEFQSALYSGKSPAMPQKDSGAKA